MAMDKLMFAHKDNRQGFLKLLLEMLRLLGSSLASEMSETILRTL